MLRRLLDLKSFASATWCVRFAKLFLQILLHFVGKLGKRCRQSSMTRDDDVQRIEETMKMLVTKLGKVFNRHQATLYNGKAAN